MAPLSSPDSSQSRFGGGLCCNSMAPTVPASGFGFDPRPHLQRLLQSSAARNEDSSFQIPEQVRQFYLAQNPEPTSGHCSSEALRSSNSSAEIAVTDPHRDPIEVDQGFPSYGHAGVAGPAISPSLIRYHSAPSSVLANLAGMTNGVFHPNSELGQFLSSSIAADVKTDLKQLDTSRNHNLHHIEKQVSMAADRLAIHGNGFMSAHSPYRQPSGGGEILSQLTMDADDVSLIRSPETLSEAGRTALQRPTSHDQNSRLIYSSKYSENGVQGVPPAKDGLLRHCSSPAGFLSQLSDEHERHMLASSSGNSSEEGNYERRGGDPGLFNGYAWDDADNIAGGHVDASSAARKRIRDLAGKSCLRSTVMDSQKPDALESSFLGSYFGMPMTDSPENTYLTDKMSSDSTPCRTRAKRGCATHPRSIAERVRRTKISERMKKLQELVPHMDKQANTAEMLDEAVEYVKCLQRQVKELTENRSKCNCACGRPKETTSSSK